MNKTDQIQIKNDLIQYKKHLIAAAKWLAMFFALAFLLTFYFDSPSYQNNLIGGFVGTLLASINLVALGYATIKLVLTNASKQILFFPLITFLTLCGAALFFALNHEEIILGFAFGLTIPLIYGSAIIFGRSKPA